ncbi:unnamed protein product, partial [marine sediment metagenome]
LFPPGDDLDTHMSKLDRTGIQDWLDYWGKIWSDLGRGDLFSFTGSKAKEYFDKLEPPPEPPPEIPWYTKYLNLTLEDLRAWRIYDVIGTIGLLSKMIEPLLPDWWPEYKVSVPTWLQELQLFLFFAPAMATGVETLVKAGATSTEANKILGLLRDKNFLKALDVMKANPLKYADDFAKLDPKIASQILKGMKKDQLAGLATHVFKASWDKGLVRVAPLWKRTMFAAAKHKW